MRLTTAISAAALFIASASATLWCQDLPPGKGGYGHLELHKNNVTTGEEYYIGFGSKTDADGNAYLVPGIQQRVDLQACDSAYIGKTGALTDGKELTIYGRLTSGGKCITRTSDSSLVLAKCITLDGPDVAPQFFTLKVPYYQAQRIL
ncbi:hypothetical protein BKA62DRAFT_645101 [Auriculariales sp. MPI-PUGE-AT-0066]|nr:hypothetical protein BKA62DRAFT_645101 [Auriculariales sp. MPI-PUGE-AT-0066]